VIAKQTYQQRSNAAFAWHAQFNQACAAVRPESAYRVLQIVVGCTRQAALERQDFSCTYLAHHELESVKFLLLLFNFCAGQLLSSLFGLL
jgi:hypothetical protein